MPGKYILFIKTYIFANMMSHQLMKQVCLSNIRPARDGVGLLCRYES
jgi:hypothetical protein